MAIQCNYITSNGFNLSCKIPEANMTYHTTVRCCTDIVHSCAAKRDHVDPLTWSDGLFAAHEYIYTYKEQRSHSKQE